jgi:hypothetical protein
MSFIKDIFDNITGRGAERAAEESTDALTSRGEQALAALDTSQERGIGAVTDAEGRALSFLDPFTQVGQQGLEQSSFLGDPQAQFDFLQNNPLFQASLDNANRVTQASAASRGRLNAGDTLQQLSNNTLLAASPLIDRQRQDIFNQLQFGGDIATRQAGIPQVTGTNVSNITTGTGRSSADLLTQIGNAEAGGIIGAQNARQSGLFGDIGGIISGGIGAGIGGLFSDSRLKADAQIVGFKNGYDVWEWIWNKSASKMFGLTGKAKGVMFSDVLDKNPEAVSYQDGYGKVNYTMIGV